MGGARKSAVPEKGMQAGWLEPTSLGHVPGLWVADLRHDEWLLALTARHHDIVAGVAQVGVGLTGLALSPHTES